MTTARDLADASHHLASIWKALDGATNSPQAAFRTPTLATIASDGSPAARTIVIRSVDANAGELRLFTDARSPKVGQLSSHPRAALSFWDPATQVQLRATGECVRLYDETACRNAWETVSEANRQYYRTTLPPGSTVEMFNAVEHVEGDGHENFALLVFVATTIDWLWLDRAGHKRCRFDLTTGERQWIVP